MPHYRVKDWPEFQHYKDRSPPWIRLHKRLLDSFRFHSLPDASRALAPMLWLLASENKDPSSGIIDGTDNEIAFRLRRSVKEIQSAIKPLIDNGFLEVVRDDSSLLADCKQLAVPETETEAEAEAEAEKIHVGKKASPYTSEFESLWRLYPRKDGSKQKAYELYKNALKSGVDHGRIESGVRAYADCINREGTERRYIAHATTWLGQKRWEADYAARSEPAKSRWIAEGERIAAQYLAEG